MHGDYDPELLLRWLQAGILGRKMRRYSRDNPAMGKEPWNYDAEITKTMS